ncbi:unnamed protein product [Rodentolepis nana]|uniref:Pescadillo homolog n=1 Tax=Rodentolepis nana TaxID=102285 RepID=A0A0R3TT97_RODNA|nr:unnamed protein product [Rodentolepis nana]
MARKIKKNTKGHAVTYITQKQAMRMLQISLPNFRRICLLKGIYPVEPKNIKKAGHGSTEPRVYFNRRDIAFLRWEPLIETFRKLRTHQMRLKRAREKLDRDKEYRLRMTKPTYTLHQLVRERYPTRKDALLDLTDSLNLIFLFSRLPRLTQFHPALISLCRRFAVEFLHYTIAMRCIRKAFISIKGFYLEAIIDDVPVVWVIPHNAASHVPTGVEYRLLATCVEFDVTLVGSLLVNLYKQAGLLYPPKLNTQAINNPTSVYCAPENAHFEFLASLSIPIKRHEEEKVDVEQMDDLVELQAIDDSVTAAVNKQIQVQKIKHLFEGKRFFFNREVPKEVLSVIIRSCGGDCSWDPLSGPGATYTEDDDRIDFQIVDRPMHSMKATRAYVQPQWVFDSLNAGRLMPVQDYLPSATLPPHLSPFAASSVVADSLNGGSMGMADALRQAAAVNAAPGFGAGSTLYRPPEMDYLAGLVSLAETRGAAVAEATEEGQSQREEMEVDDEAEEGGEVATIKTSMNKKKRKNKINKAIKKGKTVVAPGKPLDDLSRRMAEREAENAQRKLREMMLPKKHKNLYRKIVHAQKTANKDIRSLQERRKNIEKNQRPQQKSK